MSTKTIAMIFPGQGSQTVGMGRLLAMQYPHAREIFAQADDILNFELSKLCWEGPEEELRQTVNTQPALFTTSAAALAVLRAEGIKPSIVAGHSLGEYSALLAAGVLTFETGLKLVRARGEAMQAAGLERPGTMAALLSLENAQVTAICERASAKGVVVPANWNSPGQVVISGEPEAIAEAVRLAQEAGSRRSLILPVSGAFHSPLVEPAVEMLREDLDAATLYTPECHFVANVSAQIVPSVEEIRDGLAHQIISSVRWTECIETMVKAGADTFIEVGSGKVLTGLLKRINKDVKGIHFGEPEDLAGVKQALASA